MKTLSFYSLVWMGLMILPAAIPGASHAQTPAATDTKSSSSSAQTEAGEPRATTSPEATAPAAESERSATSQTPSDKPRAATPGGAAAAGAAASASEASVAGSGTGPGSGAGSSVGAGGTASHPRAAGVAGRNAGTSAASGAGGKPGGVDRLDLGAATVTGDREQPKVMYIVPWKRSDIGDLSGKPMNSLLDEALAPIDREEFKRQVMYYQAVRADASQNGAAKTPAQGEK